MTQPIECATVTCISQAVYEMLYYVRREKIRFGTMTLRRAMVCSFCFADYDGNPTLKVCAPIRLTIERQQGVPGD